jgi:hypothetical protein
MNEGLPVSFRPAKLIVVLMLTLAIGGHWIFLQSVAWVGMAVNFSQSAPISEALVKTFDGKHPCQLCKFVEQGKKTEKRQDFTKVSAKVDFFSEHQQFAFITPDIFHLRFFPAEQIPVRNSSPPSPPPKTA